MYLHVIYDFLSLARNNTAKNTTCYNKASDKISRGKNIFIWHLFCETVIS